MRTRPACDGDKVMWFWAIREHKAYHHDCVDLGNGLCGFKMIRYEALNESTGQWELLPIVNGATPEQIQVLESH